MSSIKSIFQKKKLSNKKSNMLSAWKINYIDYKNLRLLNRFMSVFERILPRRFTGVSAKHQKMLTTAVKRARFMGMLPYCTKHKSPTGERNY